VIGYRGFTFERDGYDVLRLIVIERLEDESMERTGLGGYRWNGS